MTKKLRVGLVGAGEVTQVIHLPTLQLLFHLYSIEIVCDISSKNASHCAEKFHIPQATTDAADVFQHPAVDVVFVLTSDDCHELYTIAALKAGKHVMLEKPITLSLPSAQRILDAERASGKRVFVGYMRRYAPSYLKAFKREVASIPRILYARCRDFSGPNATFTSQSGTFQVKDNDIPASAAKERDERLDKLFDEAFNGRVTPEKQKLCRFLGSLGSHDLSLMRETLGVPESISGVSVNDPFYSAIFNMRNQTGEPYTVTYESGIDAVPIFDAHLAIYGEQKRVSISYDSPYVKGLPITVKVQEVDEFGEIRESVVLSSYQDAYTSELEEMHTVFTAGASLKTSVEDAMEDLRIFDRFYAQYDQQLAQ